MEFSSSMIYNTTLVMAFALAVVLLVISVYITSTQAVLAYSTILKQGNKDNTNCNARGSGNNVSNTCNQETKNNVNTAR